MPRLTGISANLAAFLDMIAFSEGTSKLGNEDGYNVLVGGHLFQSYANHPHILIDLGRGLKSTEAGRYQLLGKYYDAYKKLLHLDDFSPVCQDLIAVQQIHECKALAYVNGGHFFEAVRQCGRIWASLPGAGYHQHENKLDDLREVYINAGGKVA